MFRNVVQERPAYLVVNYAFTLSQEMTAANHTLRVENKGLEPHEVTVVQ
ncbi:MAG TPA: hypothetical protein VF177_00215 [Anaerolineae bacterium]